MCAIVCPFDVLTYYPMANGGPPRAVATKCDGCVDRLRRGDIPACVEVCKVGALVFGELNDLVRAGRLHETGAVLAATAAVKPPAEPETVTGWRTWGRAAAELAEGGG